MMKRPDKQRKKEIGRVPFKLPARLAHNDKIYCLPEDWLNSIVGPWTILLRYRITDKNRTRQRQQKFHENL